MESNFINDHFYEVNGDNLIDEVNVVTSQLISIDEQQVIKWCYDRRYIESLQYLFSFYPQLTKDEEMKKSAFNLIMYILLNVKKTDIDSILEQMDIDQLDLLMRYVYKGLENPLNGRSNRLFYWHSAIFYKVGLGSIMRVLCDKRKI